MYVYACAYDLGMDPGHGSCSGSSSASAKSFRTFSSVMWNSTACKSGAHDEKRDAVILSFLRSQRAEAFSGAPIYW